MLLANWCLINYDSMLIIFKILFASNNFLILQIHIKDYLVIRYLEEIKFIIIKISYQLITLN